MSGRKRKLRKVNQLQTIGILIALALLGFGYHLYSQPRDLKDVFFLLPNGSASGKISVSVVHTNAGRRKGLMYVKDMPATRGMLFLFPEQQQLKFHMKNTYIPLDMIFVDKDKKVVGILHDVPPLNSIKRSVEAPSQYVVEINSGRARELGIVTGSKLVLPEGLPVPE